MTMLHVRRSLAHLIIPLLLTSSLLAASRGTEAQQANGGNPAAPTAPWFVRSCILHPACVPGAAVPLSPVPRIAPRAVQPAMALGGSAGDPPLPWFVRFCILHPACLPRDVVPQSWVPQHNRGSETRAGGPAPSQVPQAAAVTDAWYIATYLTNPAVAVPAVHPADPLPRPTPNTEAWYIATYLTGQGR